VPHFEYALREYGFESRSESLPAKASYFRRPEVVAEIDAYAAKWRAAGEPRLIGRGVTLRHWLALANYLAGRDQETERRLPAVWKFTWWCAGRHGVAPASASPGAGPGM
jgi:hypothetical protein